MKKDASMNTDQMLQQIENNQRKIIEQNKKIISLLKNMDFNLVSIKRQNQYK